MSTTRTNDSWSPIFFFLADQCFIYSIKKGLACTGFELMILMFILLFSVARLRYFNNLKTDFFISLKKMIKKKNDRKGLVNQMERRKELGRWKRCKWEQFIVVQQLKGAFSSFYEGSKVESGAKHCNGVKELQIPFDSENEYDYGICSINRSFLIIG